MRILLIVSVDRGEGWVWKGRKEIVSMISFFYWIFVVFGGFIGYKWFRFRDFVGIVKYFIVYGILKILNKYIYVYFILKFKKILRIYRIKF